MPVRKLVRISMIVPHTDAYDILAAAAGKAVGMPEVVPVMHNGENDKGELQPAHQDTRAFVTAYMSKHATFSTREVIPAGVEAGFTKNAIYACLSTLVNEGVLKRGDAGQYSVAGVKQKRASRAPARAKAGKSTNPKPGDSLEDHVVAFIAKKQNGTGEGVETEAIKAAMEKKGYSPTSVGPVLNGLVNKKKTLTRIAMGEYRTAG